VTRFILRRLGLALITLWLVSVIVFIGAQVLPGNPGRAIAGPFASQEVVVAINKELGYYNSIWTRYWDWFSGLLHGDMGTSYIFKVPVSELVEHALVNSLKLAAVAFVIVVPLSILGGVIAALHFGRPIDRTITVTGLSLSTVPEFVTGIVLIMVFGIWLDWLPITATAPSGSDAITQIKYLILPALALSAVLFGYIARMARAGTVASLDSDYTRTAVLKGLSRRTVIRRHVLRNSLLPTITVIAVQVGYLIGGLVAIELLFNYNGIGRLIYDAASKKDFPVLEASVLTVAVVYIVATLAADLLYSVLNPRIRYATHE